MWNTNSLWFEFSVVSMVFVLGHIFLGHFEERSPKGKKLFKYLFTLTIVVTISIFLGRTLAFVVLGLTFIPVIYIHTVLLPQKGINGWIAEPKSKYYDYRGWDKNLFHEQETVVKKEREIKLVE